MGVVVVVWGAGGAFPAEVRAKQQGPVQERRSYPHIRPEECRVPPTGLYFTSGVGETSPSVKPKTRGGGERREFITGRCFGGRRLTGRQLFASAEGQRRSGGRRPTAPSWPPPPSLCPSAGNPDPSPGALRVFLHA